MIITKAITNNKIKYKYYFCDISGLIEFFKLNENLIYNFEDMLRNHRPNDKDIKYTKIINENIMDYHINNFETFYQFVYEPKTFEIITMSRISIKKDLAVISMVNTNVKYRGKKFCQKNMTIFLSNIANIFKGKNLVKKFSLYVDKTNIPAIKCYEKCGFEIIKTVKNDHYLMEKPI